MKHKSVGGGRHGLIEWHTAGCILCIVIVALVLLPSPAAASSPTVIISNYTVTPAFLMPGDVGTITVVLTNTATAAARTQTDVQTQPGTVQQTTATTTEINAYVENALLRGVDGVQVLTGTYQDIGEIGPGQSIPLTFLFRANGPQGIYFPEVWVRVRGATGVKYPIPVNINSPYALIKNPSLRVERTAPVSVDPGNSFNITVSILNEGQSSANDIAILVNSSSTSITPMNSENYYIPELLPGDQKILNLSFETDKKVALGLQPILITIDYLNADNAAFRQISTVGVPIVGSAEMSVASVGTNPTPIVQGDTVTLTIRIENIGTANANSVQATIDDLPLSGTKEAFMGTIEPNNDAPAVFTLQADTPGDFAYTLTTRFTDDYGTHTTKQILRMTVAEQSPLVTIIAVIVVLVIVTVVAIYWYRRRKES
jgi:uncharacterized repeat protein (TIGR01451 family)